MPYVMPGFRLARLSAQLIPEKMTTRTLGMILLKHGVFSFGETARDSYERMIELVSRAESYLKQHDAWTITFAEAAPPERPLRDERAALRRDLAGGRIPGIAAHTRPQAHFAGARRAQLSQQGR